MEQSRESASVIAFSHCVFVLLATALELGVKQEYYRGILMSDWDRVWVLVTMAAMNERSRDGWVMTDGMVYMVFYLTSELYA